LNNNNHKAGAAAEMTASRKEDKYVDLGARYIFEPIAVKPWEFRVVGPWNRLPVDIDFSSLDLNLLSIVLICQTVCYIVLIRVVVSAPHGAFLSLTGIVLFLSAYTVYVSLSLSVLNK